MKLGLSHVSFENPCDKSDYMIIPWKEVKLFNIISNLGSTIQPANIEVEGPSKFSETY